MSVWICDVLMEEGGERVAWKTMAGVARRLVVLTDRSLFGVRGFPSCESLYGAATSVKSIAVRHPITSLCVVQGAGNAFFIAAGHDWAPRGASSSCRPPLRSVRAMFSRCGAASAASKVC